MRYDNYLKRVLKPAAEAVGLEGITHQMLRRSFSTMALDSGASPKDVQGQMRHTEARMSLYLLAAAGKGAISADRRGPRRQCSVAATGHRPRWNWFQKEKILTDRQ